MRPVVIKLLPLDTVHLWDNISALILRILLEQTVFQGLVLQALFCSVSAIIPFLLHLQFQEHLY
jgi:hypothetical protein